MSIIRPLKYWVKQVEILKSWTHYSEWSNAEFTVLSEEISELSGTRITRNAIRKIIEKLNNENHNYNPQTATKNALAQHIGYANWKELESKAYSETETEETEHITVSKSAKKTTRPRWWLAIGLLITIGVLGILFLKPNVNTPSADEILFKIENPVGVVPHTIKCIYDVSNIATDNIKIDFRHKSHSGVYLMSTLNKNDSTVQQCFHYPGLYFIKLLVDDNVLKEQYVRVDSKGWFVFAADAQIDTITIPEVAKGNIYGEKHILFDQILKSAYTPNGEFFIPPKTIKGLPNVSANYHTHLKNVQDFGVALENCSLECRFKNEAFNDVKSCNEAMFILQGTKGVVLFQFVEKGCVFYARYTIGDKTVSIKNGSVDFLALDYSAYKTVRITCRPDTISLWVENRKIFEKPHKSELGELHGIKIRIKGSPHIDFVNLYNAKDEIVFSDNFRDTLMHK
jgi:hypothetical protein